jgi:hypothetical protein
MYELRLLRTPPDDTDGGVVELAAVFGVEVVSLVGYPLGGASEVLMDGTTEAEDEGREELGL